MTSERDAEWARVAAERLLEQDDAGAIETADYRDCSFILAVARLVLEDVELAAKVGAAMEPERR